MNNKGVSPLIAAVLLVAFTMTVAAILATWSSSFVRTKTQEAEQEQEERSLCSGLAMNVESAKYDSSAEEITALVWNTGDETLENIKVNVYYSDINLTTKLPTKSNVTIDPGDFAALKITDISRTPTKIGLRSFPDQCSSIQPLYVCTYSNNRLVC
ncbi:MAG: archaellin/type IV pilin N-terminal domain-containing protein [Candidatus Aenigmatarchaeota archaeon]